MKSLFLCVLIASFLAASPLAAHGGREDGMDLKEDSNSTEKTREKDDTKVVQASTESQDKLVRLNGMFIELGCLAYHGSEDAGHSDCAERCARAGAPLALKDDASGTFYVVITDGHFVNPAEPAFGKIGVPVTVDGVIKRAGTVDTITLKKVDLVNAASKAKAAKPKSVRGKNAKGKDEHGH